jgi:hypothetical protein
MIRNYVKYARESKYRITVAQAPFNNKTLTSKLDLNSKKKKIVKSYIWSIVLYDAESWTLRQGDQK